MFQRHVLLCHDINESNGYEKASSDEVRIMQHIELDGLWNVKAKDAYRLPPPDMQRATEWIPAQVPGTIHTDLLTEKLIPDPFYRMNENDVQWIENLQWIYRREFEMDAASLEERHIVLVAEGLDTYARILINGKQVAETANMFVEHRFDVKRYVKAGTNVIEIQLDSAVVRSKQLEKKYGALQVALDGHRVYVRKAQYSFGWDWGPKLTSSGIWRPIYIEASSGPILRNPFVRTVTLKKSAATIEVSADIGHFHSPVTVTVKIQGHGYSREIVKRANSSSVRFKVSIDKPHLWWPNGHGEQPLYVATLSLQTSGRVTSEVTATFGIRTIRLLQEKDAEGKSFIIAVNGEKIFCKGANWIPSDSFIPRITDSTYEQLLTMARDANMNMLRVWGGGIYEQEIFYSLCDRLGLLVWQDFMFACGEYPQTPWFLKLVKDEATKAVTRLRSHPSLALWCGNNECEWLFCMDNADKTADDMRSAVIFREVLPAIVKRLDSSRPYWRSSPFGTGFPNDESNGNHHQWSVWSAWKDYKEYEKDNARFVTEFGFQAPANIRTWEEATLPDDRHPQHPVLEHHNKQVEGQERLFRFLSAHYTLPANFDNFVYRGQLVQANALKTAVEHWRRKKYHTAGALFWQLNDCWPVSSWSVIDSALRPKASYYYAKRFFAKVLLSLKHNGDRIEMWGTNDAFEPIKGILYGALLSFDGARQCEVSNEVSLTANGSVKIGEIPVRFSDILSKNNSYVLAQFSHDKKILSENRYFFVEPKHLHLPKPKWISNILRKSENRYQVDIHTDLFAKDVRIDVDGIEADFSDNYFDMDAGESKTVNCTVSAMPEAVERSLRIISL
jgi:beta-mannosidase